MTTYDIATLAREQLEKAAVDSAGRSSVTLVHDGALRQTVIALLAGRILDEHTMNGVATLQIVRGTVRLQGDSGSMSLREGEIAHVPQDRHSVHADTDSVCLLSVAMGDPAKG
jgi:quercetin dioxygenase-like cupin family protein